MIELKSPEFSPGARYNRATDTLYVLWEDCSYRVKPGAWPFDYLFHPHQERLVGVKVARVSLLLE